MDLQKLEKMTDALEENLNNASMSMYVGAYPQLMARVRDLFDNAMKAFPEHRAYFSYIDARLGSMYKAEALEVIGYIRAIAKIEKISESKTSEMKIFESAEEKLKQANISFRKEDYTSTIHNLNTTLELVLKDKVGIPSTITGVNTSNIIDVLTKYKVAPFLYLEEARKHVLLIDNKIKHNAYSPSKIECINGIKAMEELIAKLRNVDMKLNEEVKNKIYEGL
jgi:hypothetical protein